MSITTTTIKHLRLGGLKKSNENRQGLDCNTCCVDRCCGYRLHSVYGETNMRNFLKKLDYRHYICIGLTVLFALLSGLLAWKSYARVGESVKDFGLSVAYYVKTLFRLPADMQPSVGNLSKWFDRIDFPFTFSDFKVDWQAFWQTFVSKANFSLYLKFLGQLLYHIFFYGIIVVIPFIMAVILLFTLHFKVENNDWNKDSKPLIMHKKASKRLYTPIKLWIEAFIVFVKENSVYWKIWLSLFLVSFNVITVVVEFFAYYFYFAVSLDFVHLYRQVYKFAIDVSPLFTKIPFVVWLVAGLVVFDKFRRSIAYKRLNHNEMKDRGFINERPIVFMVCGTMGKKKTTVITDIALSQEVMFRDKALDMLISNDMKFPNFPWINLEKTLQEAMRRHIIYNLATTRKFIKRLYTYWWVSYQIPSYKKSIRRHLKKAFPFAYYDNFLFDYDYNQYGLEYDDKLKVQTIWEVIEIYSQLYFVYVIQSSLIISNYSIRTDNVLEDNGNFPLWNTDFFRRDSKEVDVSSRHSHILDFDTLRLGLKVLEDNENADNFEFGVINITEIGKERGNVIELADKIKKAETANQKNDLFNSWLKMVRHSATIDNFPFVRVVTDEQRPESWGLDARALCEIVSIKKTSDIRLAMPFFAVEEMLYSVFWSKFVNLYLKYRYNRGDNTLTMHVLKTLTAKIVHYYTGIYNLFGYSLLNIQVESGTQDGAIEDRKYFLSSKKIYSKRFSTDCFSDFFTEKSLRSRFGIDDLKEYATEKATLEELQEQNSYFVNDLTRTFNKK